MRAKLSTIHMEGDAVNTTKEKVIEQGRLLSVEDVMKMWQVSREWLCKKTHALDESERIPCFMFGTRPKYSLDELGWWREKHRFEPSRKRGKK